MLPNRFPDDSGMPEYNAFLAINLAKQPAAALDALQLGEFVRQVVSSRR
jgi:hypothetical protein